MNDIPAKQTALIEEYETKHKAFYAAIRRATALSEAVKALEQAWESADEVAPGIVAMSAEASTLREQTRLAYNEVEDRMRAMQGRHTPMPNRELREWSHSIRAYCEFPGCTKFVGRADGRYVHRADR